MDWALNNSQRLIFHKIKENQTIDISVNLHNSIQVDFNTSVFWMILVLPRVSIHVKKNAM